MIMYNGASQFAYALFYAIISINSVTSVLTLKIPKKIRWTSNAQTMHSINQKNNFNKVL